MLNSEPVRAPNTSSVWKKVNGKFPNLFNFGCQQNGVSWAKSFTHMQCSLSGSAFTTLYSCFTFSVCLLSSGFLSYGLAFIFPGLSRCYSGLLLFVYNFSEGSFQAVSLFIAGNTAISENVAEYVYFIFILYCTVSVSQPSAGRKTISFHFGPMVCTMHVQTLK